MNRKKHIFIILMLLMAGLSVQHVKAQKRSVLNLPQYNSQRLHFGFFLGINNTNFMVHEAPNMGGYDSLKTITSEPQKGFNLGIVSELKIAPYWKLRFVPDLAFSQRNLAYHFEGHDTLTNTKKIESTFLDFPIDVKLRSKRLNNGEAYLLAGGRYTHDLASQKGVNVTSINDEVVRLIKNDFGYEVGAGAEFYLPYFKFAIEGKLSMGVRNLLIKDFTVYTQSLDKLQSKVFLISFTFEG